MCRHYQINTASFRVFTAVFDVTGQGSLTRIQIDAGDTGTRRQQRGDDMHGRRGFARAALLIANDNDMGVLVRRVVGGF